MDPASSLDDAMASYLGSIDAGRPDARERALREHPRHAAALRAHFDAEDLLGGRVGGSLPDRSAAVGCSSTTLPGSTRVPGTRKRRPREPRSQRCAD
jgi:hypothetical protein